MVIPISKQNVNPVWVGAAVMVVLAVVGFFFFKPLPQSKDFQTDRLVVETNTGRQIPLSIEIADTRAKQEQGLMFRPHMEAQHGMLFIYDKPQLIYMWMRNTQIALDMIFADREGQILHVHANARPYDETAISSQFPAQLVLEIKGGQAEKFGIKAGDRLITPILEGLK